MRPVATQGVSKVPLVHFSVLQLPCLKCLQLWQICWNAYFKTHLPLLDNGLKRGHGQGGAQEADQQGVLHPDLLDDSLFCNNFREMAVSVSAMMNWADDSTICWETGSDVYKSPPSLSTTVLNKGNFLAIYESVFMTPSHTHGSHSKQEIWHRSHFEKFKIKISWQSENICAA